MIKNISRTKLFFTLISLIITFFVWQQGLRESLNRPSVSFDIGQKEKEITELSIQSIPISLQKYVIPNDPVAEINSALSKEDFNQLSERNKLIWMISADWNKLKIDQDIVIKMFKKLKRKVHIANQDDLTSLVKI